jgi:hypothetical protein
MHPVRAAGEPPKRLIDIIIRNFFCSTGCLRICLGAGGGGFHLILQSSEGSYVGIAVPPVYNKC